MRGSLSVLFIAASSLAGAPASAQTIESESWSEPRAGLRVLRGTTSSPTTRFYAAFADLCADHVHVAATARPTSRRTASSWGGSVGAQLAVNGDFFEYESPPRVTGLAVGDAVPWPVAQTGESAAATSDWYYRRYGWIAFGPGWVDFNHTRWVKNNRTVTEGWEPETITPTIPSGTVALVSGFPELVTEGARYTCSSPTASSCFPDRTDMRSRHPRTAMGITEDRQTFILLVVDGRSTSSVGMYGAELASLIHQLGAWQAFNLDGGGSSQMWLTGSGTINSPSDGSPRAVANHWGIFAGSGTGMPRAPGSCMPLSIDECFRRNVDGAGCEEEQTWLDAAFTAGDTTSDVDGDGLADACIRSGADYRCRRSDGDAWGGFHVQIDALGDGGDFTEPQRWSTIRMGDVNGDGRADVCARLAEGVRCWPSTADGAGPPIEGPPLADAGGWGGAAYGGTLRVGDVNGDGLDDLCVRRSTDFRCYPSTGVGFDEPFVGPEWSDAAGFSRPDSYGTIRMGDVDGDGLRDVCARTSEGVVCHRSTGDGFGPAIAGPAWTDAQGFANVRYWSTMRLADVSGDGLDDLCIRTATELRCHFSSGDGFGSAQTVAAMPDDRGWAQHDNYATLRTGDIDGDGAQDLCIRANAGVRCWAHRSGGFERIVASDLLSNADGWSDPRYYLTIRLADVNGDGRADLCARAAAGLRCWPSTGDGFGAAISVDGYDDGRGFGVPERYGTFRIAGPRCMPVAESCDGADDDCDGAIDEGACVADGGTIGPGGDGGVLGREDGSVPDLGDGGPTAELSGGCGCRTTAPGDAPSGVLVLGVLSMLIVRRRAL